MHGVSEFGIQQAERYHNLPEKIFQSLANIQKQLESERRSNCSNRSGIIDAMAAPRKRIKSGDVLLVHLTSGVAYLHYLGRHPEYGDAVLVSGRFAEPVGWLTSDTFAGGFVTFYPAASAVYQGLVKAIGNLPPLPLPSHFRRAGARSGRRIDTWIIETPAGEKVKSTLSPMDLQLPIASIWNHELLTERIMEGWHPSQVGLAP